MSCVAARRIHRSCPSHVPLRRRITRQERMQRRVAGEARPRWLILSGQRCSDAVLSCLDRPGLEFVHGFLEPHHCAMNQCALSSSTVRFLYFIGVFEAILDMDKKGVDVDKGITAAGANLEAIDICGVLSLVSTGLRSTALPRRSDIRCKKWYFICLSGITSLQLGSGHLLVTSDSEYLSASGGSSRMGMRCATALETLSIKKDMSRWMGQTDRQTERVSHGQREWGLSWFQSTNLVGVDMDLELEKRRKRDIACLAYVLWWWWCGPNWPKWHNWNHGNAA